MSGRREGRPPLDRSDPSVSVHVRVPTRQYDAVYERAQAARVSVPEFIRRAVAARTSSDEDEDD
jgi:hypothetical protein